MPRLRRFSKIFQRFTIPRLEVRPFGDCKNWKFIVLLTIASKVLSKIILLGMKDCLEERLRDEQAGFRMKLSCCDHVTTSRIILEQTLEWNIGLYMVSVVFKKPSIR